VRNGSSGPLDLERRLRLEVEHAAHMAPGFLADAQAAGRRRLLEPGGDVDGEAADRAVVVDAAAEQDMAGVDADPHLEAFLAVGARDPFGLQPRLGEQVEAGEHRALGVVLARGLGAEGGEQAVAGVLQHLAAALHHPGAERLQRRVHDVEQVLGIDGLAERGRADHVEEQHRHLAPPRRCAAMAGLLLGEQRRERGIDDRAAEHRSLRLERRDRLGQGVVRQLGLGHRPTV
jgi:hypothetical protein